ncbi:sel1 repeat family protein [Candidatus Thioglobus sp.]|nr:sel1 repeat family protein [Candidatus Thioglobus sp.]
MNTNSLEEERKNAEAGKPSSQFNMGIVYFIGDGVEKDLNEAELWFKKAAKQDYFQSYNLLGLLYQETKNWQKAFDSYQVAVDNDIPEAQCYLGEIYCFVNSYSEIGIKQDLKKAFALFTKAASRILGGGRNQARAQHLLGEMYINGEGTEQNFEQGLTWLRRSVAMGEVTGYVGGEYSIGMAYKKGLGVSPDLDKAFKWLEIAANKNYAEAQLEISIFYQKGLGNIAIDLNASFSWLVKAAEGGRYVAQRLLGQHYRLGSEQAKQDGDKALIWLERAAIQGDLEAIEWTGKLYLKKENFQNAAFMLSIAKKGGSKDAEELWDKHELWKYGNYE